LNGVTDDKAFFTLYTNTNNPDQKAALAYRITDDKLIWWNNDFSIEKVTPKFVFGTTMRMGTRKLILDAETGNEYAFDQMKDVRIEEKVQHPHHYPADHPYFATVAKFFSQKFNLLPTTALEYLEHDSLIFISCYFQENDLVNYMFVLSPDGDLLLKEKLGERLKGIGLDTFFILSGCLFFVRNKGELVSYKIL
jgi:hypothetical protein